MLKLVKSLFAFALFLTLSAPLSATPDIHHKENFVCNAVLEVFWTSLDKVPAYHVSGHPNYMKSYSPKVKLPFEVKVAVKSIDFTEEMIKKYPKLFAYINKNKDSLQALMLRNVGDYSDHFNNLKFVANLKKPFSGNLSKRVKIECVIQGTYYWVQHAFSSRWKLTQYISIGHFSIIK